MDAGRYLYGAWFLWGAWAAMLAPPGQGAWWQPLVAVACWWAIAGLRDWLRARRRR